MKVRSGFDFEHLPLTCKEGRATINGSFSFGMPVDRHKFSGRATFGAGGTVTVKGEFSHRGKQADGTSQANGNFPAVKITGCHSGTLDWHAHRT